ncbi:TPA: phage repressor protein CI [Serratia marcescens]|jgi:phage repressor protein C with HTH and peptisase S24 domain|uniref:phage repressor protein CI n=1 Tax=Serratia TaxID=613 RepID=UPI0013DC174C|nr:phage repressor protein CI [Serratia marcescens]NGD64901.1 phage repressor protein [Serratia marcescens]
MDFKTGGTEAINRMLEAYNFRFRQELCDHLGISKSTLATWYNNDTFPGNQIIRCALETGVSLQWLATGEGAKYEHSQSDISTLNSYRLMGTQLKQSGKMMFDKVFLPNNLKDPYVIRTDAETYFVDKGERDHSDGLWLVEIEGKHSIRELAFIPVRKVRVIGGGVPFDCGVDEIKIIARVVGVFRKE